MARIPYPDVNSPDLSPLVERIIQERGKLLNVYRMLLHSPVIAEGWLKLFTAIRNQASLTGRIRELVILRIAVINGAEYEFDQHLPIALNEGATEVEVEAIKSGSMEIFSEKDRAVLALCDQMTKTVHVDDVTFQQAVVHFSYQEVVELVATIAGYNLVSRFLEAIAIDQEGSEGSVE